MGKRHKRKYTTSTPLPSDAPQVPIPPEDEESNDTLIDDLLAELDARDVQQGQLSSEKSENTSSQLEEERKAQGASRARFKAREMRRIRSRLAMLPSNDEADTQRVAEETAAEEKTIRALCEKQGLRIQEMNPDGHCLFSAVADQLALLSILPPAEATYHTTRKSAADYIQSHPDDFLPFLVPLSEDNADGAMTNEEFPKYCDMIRLTAAWGGEPEILALSRAYNVPIHVIQGGRPFEVIHRPNDSDENSSDMVVRISYHRRMYGLGEHYNSLHPNRIPS